MFVHYKSSRVLLIWILFFTLNVTAAQAQVANTKEARDYKYAAGLYSEGMYQMAIRELESFIDAYPSSEYLINARLLIAGSHFYLKDFSRAIQITGRIQKE